ncbi:MAG: Ig-like domain-containing protein [Deltaproteobacteria bacterium]|nr:Ig-like domain-containing protein [Deltaproteobacteria bacterium]
MRATGLTAAKLWLRRRRRSGRRWLDLLLGVGRPTRARDPWPVPFLWMGVLLIALTGCEKQPAKIRVKLPRDAVQSVKMDPVLPPFTKKGESITLRASAFDKDDVYMGPAKVKWSVQDGTVAAVNYEGSVTILSSGDTKVIATSEGYEQTLTAELPIKAVIVEQVKISGPPENKLHLGDTLQLAAQAIDDRGNPIADAKIEWRTSDYAATVSPTGEVEGRAIGDTQVIAEADGKVARYEVIVLDWKKGAK